MNVNVYDDESHLVVVYVKRLRDSKTHVKEQENRDKNRKI